MVRAFMGKKKVVVCEWITAVGSGTWIVPRGCKTIDIFLCAGGANGASTNGGGNGGNGGGYKSIYKIGVTPNSNITYTVGGGNANTVFGNTTVTAGTGPSGGGGASSNGNGSRGASGIYPFDNNKLFKQFCTGGGGGGCAISDSYSEEGYYNTSYGGSPNGGGAKSWYFYDSGWKTHHGQEGYPGGIGQYYGSGGGGGGFARTSLYGFISNGSCGTGYQGCIILVYEREKRPTDVVDKNLGMVKVNWPSNA